MCNIGKGITGYAQLPTNTTSSTDGVVLDYRVVGTNSNTIVPGHNLGRVGTHEVAHWLGLLEIWGNTTCGSDNVADTPLHNALNTGCPEYPHLSSCSGTPIEMTMNFMDMTNDACRYMFTLGQKARIRALLDGTSGSRATLKNSLGCLPPGATCNAPNNLASSNISTNSFTVSWGAVSGASGYFVEWKQNAATVWNEIAISDAALTMTTISGLNASNTYNVRVRTNCSGTLSVYSSTINIATSAGLTCGQPSTLSISNITSTGATCSWPTVSGVSIYSVEYGLFNSNVWTVLPDLSSNSVQLSGLQPSTSYSVRVRSKCSSILFSSYTTGSFGTTASDNICPDTFEPNNSTSKAKQITPGISINATIATALDLDYFSFNNTTTLKNVKVTLSNIPAEKDYDLILLRKNGNKIVQVNKSENAGNLNEVIVYNSSNVGTYYAYVLPYTGSFDPVNCYSLLAQISSSSFSLPPSVYSNDQEPVKEVDLILMPNPASEMIRIIMPFDSESREGVLSITDMSGRILTSTSILAENELHVSDLNISHLTSGLYIVQFTTGSKSIASKLIINH